MDVTGFEASSLFYDDTNFPRGFNKSGDFTITESQTLLNYGQAMKALYSGERDPVTTDEKHFVAVCHGAEQPVSLLEKTWVKYLQIINKSLFSISPFSTSAS